MQDLIISGVPENVSKWYGLNIFRHQETEVERNREKSYKKMKKELLILRKELMKNNKQQKKFEGLVEGSEKIINRINQIESQLIDWGYDI
jgi:hypothetical protein